MTRFFLAATVAAIAAMPVLAADGVQVIDPYARASTAMSQSGAAFMRFENHSDTDRRLVGARSDVAERVELHTHSEDANGVMRMFEVEGGFLIPANGAYLLERGGDHLMFLGLSRPLEHGDDVTVTLVFEQGDEMDITIPVDLERMPSHGHSPGHSDGHSHDPSHGQSHGHGHAHD